LNPIYLILIRKPIHISICGPYQFEPDLPSKPEILLARKSRTNRRRQLFLFHFSRPNPVSIRPKQPCQPTWPCGLHGPLRPSPPRIHPLLLVTPNLLLTAEAVAVCRRSPLWAACRAQLAPAPLSPPLHQKWNRRSVLSTSPPSVSPLPFIS
jgi:hypothetical protein